MFTLQEYKTIQKALSSSKKDVAVDLIDKIDRMVKLPLNQTIYPLIRSRKDRFNGEFIRYFVTVQELVIELMVELTAGVPRSLAVVAPSRGSIGAIYDRVFAPLEGIDLVRRSERHETHGYLSFRNDTMIDLVSDPFSLRGRSFDAAYIFHPDYEV